MDNTWKGEIFINAQVCSNCFIIEAKDPKSSILKELKKQGCRITKQRKLIIDIILENECSSCKEIYCEVRRKDPTVGIATVYRMLKAMEETGAIDRKNLYRVTDLETWNSQSECIVRLKDNKIIQLSSEMLTEVIKAGLSVKNGLQDDDVEAIIFTHSKGDKEL